MLLVCVHWQQYWLTCANRYHDADILRALDHQLDARWRVFGTFLNVEYANDVTQGLNSWLQTLQRSIGWPVTELTADMNANDVTLTEQRVYCNAFYAVAFIAHMYVASPHADGSQWEPYCLHRCCVASLAAHAPSAHGPLPYRLLLSQCCFWAT